MARAGWMGREEGTVEGAVGCLGGRTFFAQNR
jgi:hypothetical protein